MGSNKGPVKDRARKVCAVMLGRLALVSCFLPATVLATITGVVKNDAGKPVSGAFVRFVNSSDSTLDVSTFADSLGRYSLALPAGVEQSLPSRDPGIFPSLVLEHNLPNPKGDQTDIPFVLPARGTAQVQVITIGGRIVYRFSATLNAGRHEVLWRPGRSIASGVYVYRLAFCGLVVQKTLIVAGDKSSVSAALGSGGRQPLSVGKASATAASGYRAFVYGKGVFPNRTDGISISDGGTKDFTLTQVDLWDSTRIILRDSLINCRAQFLQNKKGRIVFLGGSVTNMDGWRDSITAYLRARFPQATLDIVNQGIPSVGSNMHAFRLQKDIFSLGPIDLMFIDVAGNDTINNIRDNINATARFRAMEGIIRQARAVNPSMDLVELYIAYDAFYPSVQAYDSIPFLNCYERSACYYGVSCVNLAQYVAERYTWQEFGGDVHPAAFGQGIYASVIRRLFDRAWKDSLPAGAHATPHFTPARPLDSLCYQFGHYDSITAAQLISGWNYVASWSPTDNVGTRDGFVNVPAITASAAGATLSFSFSGTAVGVVSPEGPDVGILNCQIDGVTKPAVDQFTPWSSGLHIPWIWMFATDLANTNHTLTLTVANTKDAGSTGFASRIFQFAVNGSK